LRDDDRLLFDSRLLNNRRLRRWDILLAVIRRDLRLIVTGVCLGDWFGSVAIANGGIVLCPL
jgi:hypothetical protein